MGTPIVRAEEVAEGAAVPFEAEVGGLRRECVLLRVRGELRAWVNQCAHRRQPVVIDAQPLREDGTIECEAHGTVFDATTGECIDGPCTGAFLVPVPFHLRDGIVTADDDPVDDSVFAADE